MIVLETGRLSLRHLEAGDLGPLFALYRDPEMRRHYPDGTRTLDETRSELEWFMRGYPNRPELGLWATIEREYMDELGRCHIYALARPRARGGPAAE